MCSITAGIGILGGYCTTVITMVIMVMRRACQCHEDGEKESKHCFKKLMVNNPACPAGLSRGPAA